MLGRVPVRGSPHRLGAGARGWPWTDDAESVGAPLFATNSAMATIRLTTIRNAGNNSKKSILSKDYCVSSGIIVAPGRCGEPV